MVGEALTGYKMKTLVCFEYLKMFHCRGGRTEEARTYEDNIEFLLYFLRDKLLPINIFFGTFAKRWISGQLDVSEI